MKITIGSNGMYPLCLFEFKGAIYQFLELVLKQDPTQKLQNTWKCVEDIGSYLLIFAWNRYYPVQKMSWIY